MKVFVECCRCGHIVYTEKTNIFDLMRDGKLVSCKGCGEVLERMRIFICTKERDDGCDNCEYRFYCFSQLPFEATI